MPKLKKEAKRKYLLIQVLRPIRQIKYCIYLTSTRLSLTPIFSHEEVDFERDYNTLCFISLVLSFNIY